MNIDTKAMLSITDANHNFSKVTRIVEDYGSAVILKNNEAKYMVLDLARIDEKTAEGIMNRIARANKRKYNQ